LLAIAEHYLEEYSHIHWLEYAYIKTSSYTHYIKSHSCSHNAYDHTLYTKNIIHYMQSK